MIVAALLAIRAVLWSIGVVGISTSPLTSSIVAGGVFVMGLVVAGTLSDYRDAERAPTDLAAGLYAILREAESFERVWGKPDLRELRERLIAVVTTLRSDINTGNTRDCQAAIEEVGESLLELEESDVPANYVVRLRAEQAGLRKSLLRVYHIQREQFLPSAKAMIYSIVAVILLRLLNVIDTPFKVGQERTDDDVSLFLLTEFMVHAQAAGADVVPPEDAEAHATAIEEQLVEADWRRQRTRRRQRGRRLRRRGTEWPGLTPDDAVTSAIGPPGHGPRAGRWPGTVARFLASP